MNTEESPRSETKNVHNSSCSLIFICRRTYSVIEPIMLEEPSALVTGNGLSSFLTLIFFSITNFRSMHVEEQPQSKRAGKCLSSVQGLKDDVDIQLTFLFMRNFD